MAYVGSKGWYISELKSVGITKLDGRKLEVLKTHQVAKLYDMKVKNLVK
jgi:hypothetical protein